VCEAERAPCQRERERESKGRRSMVGVVRSPGGHRILTKSAVTPRVSSRASPRRCEVSFRKRRDLVVAFDGQNELETTSPAETSAGNDQPYCGCGKCDGKWTPLGLAILVPLAR